MDFETFIKQRCPDFYKASLRGALQRFGRSIDRAEEGLITLLKKNDPSLDPFNLKSLLRMADAYREYVEWKNAARLVRRTLTQNRLALPDGSLNIAYTAGELGALERAAKMCQRSGYPDHASWTSAVQAHISLWNAGVDLSLSEGTAEFTVTDADHPGAALFAGQEGATPVLREIASHTWLRARRAEQNGVLTVTLTLPWAEIERQAVGFLPQLGLLAQKRGIASVIEELESHDLEPAVRAIMDETAEHKELDSARQAYLDLIETPPLQVSRVMAVHMQPDNPAVGIAILDKGGQVRHKGELELRAETDLEAICQKQVAEYKPEAAVLPAMGLEEGTLAKLAQCLAPLPIHRVQTMAIEEASKRFSMGALESAAIVLGRRAIKPAREWSKVDPLTLKLGEHCDELDEEKLRVVLVEAKALSSRERSRKSSPPRAEAQVRSATGRIVGKRLNPMVKTIRDLKPGMMVDGIITNITRFGAFVNIGLPTEGMIHVSQLANEFVENPSQVVKVGQHVTARVIELIPEKHRIALSLKPAPEQIEFNGKGPLPRGDGKSRQAPKGRSSALADLNALFKK